MRRPLIDKTNHIGYMPLRNGCGGVIALRFPLPLQRPAPRHRTLRVRARRPTLRMRKRALARAAQNQGYAPRQTGSVRARTVSAIAPPEPSRRECRSPQAVRKIIRAAKPVRFRHTKAPVVPFAFPFQALSRARRRGMGCARTAAGPAPGPLSLSLSKAARRRPGWLSGALGWPNRVAFDRLRLSGVGCRDGWAVRMHRNRAHLAMTKAWRW